MTEREKQAYNYATERLQDPCFPEYNWESEIVDAHIEGQDYMIEKACEWLKSVMLNDDIYGVGNNIENLKELINDFKKAMNNGIQQK